MEVVWRWNYMTNKEFLKTAIKTFVTLGSFVALMYITLIILY